MLCSLTHIINAFYTPRLIKHTGKTMGETSSNKTVSYVIVTYNREAELLDCISSVINQEYRKKEVIIVSNSKESELESIQSRFETHSCINFFHYSERMGVPKARNIAYKKANGDIIITLDDDAILGDEYSTQSIVEQFQNSSDVGIIAFMVENFFSDEIEFPKKHSDLEQKAGLRPEMRPTRAEEMADAVETNTFMGAGYALRASILDEIGYYPPEFEYGSEELDLSLRALDSGHKIMYDPSVKVRHKRVLKERRADEELIQKNLENRLRLAMRRLPLRYVVKSFVFWGGRTLYKMRGDPRPFLKGLYTILKEMPDLNEERKPIQYETIEYIENLGGRCW